MKAVVLATLSSLSLFGQWITGYYSSGNAVEPVSAIPWSKYTHIVLFAGGPCAANDGTVCMGHLTQSDIDAFIANRPSGKKALVSLGDQCAGLNGCGDSRSWIADTAPGLVGTFAQNIANFVNSNGFDGVDFDWEGVGSGLKIPVSQYESLLSLVRAALPNKTITIAAGNWGGLPTVAANQQANLDQVNVLCYDQDQISTSWYNDAIHPSTFGGGCSSRTAELTSSGLAAAKVGVGVPFYGRRWTGCTQINQKCPQSGAFSYAQLVADTTRWQPRYRFYDTIYKSNYLSIPNSDPSGSEFDSYNGVEFVADVTAWAASNKFGGFMTFALEYEYLSNQTGDARYPLSTALYRAVFGTTPAIAENSASYATGTLAPDMIAYGEASNIASALTVAPEGAWPTTLSGVTLEITDSQGQIRPAPIYYVNTNSIAYLIPAGTARGPASAKLTTSSGATISEALNIDRIAPGLYSANSSGSGVAAGLAVRASSNGTQSWGYLFDLSSRNPVPVDLGPAGDQVYLSLYGTGFRAASQATATVGGVNVPVYGFAAAGAYQGEDLINIGPLPRSLVGRGESPIQITFDGKAANLVTVSIR